jgi:hypothetical protein
VIIHAFKQQAHGAIFRDPVTSDISQSIGCVYVDDTDLYTAGPDLPSVESVAETTQHDVPIWSQSLGATGGAVKDKKSGWVLVSHECSEGVWSLKETSYDLRIPISGEDIVLTQNKLSTSTKSLGVITSPSGGHQDHIAKVREKTDAWCSRISNGHLPVSHVIMSYLHQLWPALRYGLSTLTNDWSSASECLISTEFKILPLLGVNRHINNNNNNHTKFTSYNNNLEGERPFQLPCFTPQQHRLSQRLRQYNQTRPSTASVGNKGSMPLQHLAATFSVGLPTDVGCKKCRRAGF